MKYSIIINIFLLIICLLLIYNTININKKNEIIQKQDTIKTVIIEKDTIIFRDTIKIKNKPLFIVKTDTLFKRDSIAIDSVKCFLIDTMLNSKTSLKISVCGENIAIGKNDFYTIDFFQKPDTFKLINRVDSIFKFVDKKALGKDIALSSVFFCVGVVSGVLLYSKIK